MVQGKRPILALEIDIEEVFFHCAKAFPQLGRLELASWDPPRCPAWPRSRYAQGKGYSLAELEDYFSEGTKRKVLC